MTKRAAHLPATQARFDELARQREADRATGKPGVRLPPAAARGAGVNSRRQTSAQSLDGVGARVPNKLGKSPPAGTGPKKPTKGNPR